MQCLALLREDLCAALRGKTLPHPVTMTSELGIFLRELRANRHFLLIAELTLINDELADALRHRPDSIDLYVITPELNFQIFQEACAIHSTEIYCRSSLLADSVPMFSQMIEIACQRFFERLYILLYQSVHSTDTELTHQLLPMLKMWDDHPIAIGICAMQGDDDTCEADARELLKSFDSISLSLSDGVELLFTCPAPQNGTPVRMPEAFLRALTQKHPQAHITLGISTPLVPGDRVIDKVSEARTALMIRFYHPQQLCFFQRELFATQNDYVRLITLEKQLSNAILSCFETPRLRAITAEYVRYFSDMRLIPSVVYDSVYRFLNSLDRVFKYIDPLCAFSVDTIHPSDLSRCHTLEALRDMLDELFVSFVESADHYKAASDIPVSRIESYLSTNLSEPLSLDQIAKAFNVNKFMLCKYFKQQTGANLWDYLVDLRMEQAAKLLAKTEQKIYTIAHSVGYNDSTYFSTVFKRFHGVSPKEYRESSRA